jgi:hypothetical protein
VKKNLSIEDCQAITLRGIGEMVTRNPDSQISLTYQSFDFDRPKALVTMGEGVSQV